VAGLGLVVVVVVGREVVDLAFGVGGPDALCVQMGVVD